MPTNYQALAAENLLKYGTDIARFGKMLLAERYSDRTHFVFELLQNAEDALSWRPKNSPLPKTVSFNLQKGFLEFSHFGLPFEEKHVRGICGIVEGTKKEFTAIGRFGIGFKSVYAFTQQPEIHSGEEHFAIETYVRPKSVPPRTTKQGQTLFHIPFDDAEASQEIFERLCGLGHRALLFLKHIDEVQWHSSGRLCATYRREAKPLGTNVRKVTLISESVERVQPETPSMGCEGGVAF